MSRKKRRALQREEAFNTEMEEAEEGAKSKLKMPNQKAVARKSKTEARTHGPVLGKRLMPGEGAAKKKQKTDGAAAPSKAAAAKKKQSTNPRKFRSHSKPKFAKRRK